MIYLFGDCELRPSLRELRRNGQVVAVEPKVFDLLLCLIESRHRLLTRDELNEQIWKGRLVSDGALSRCVKLARQAIGDSGKRQDVVRTVPRHGFRFTGSVEVREATSAPDRPASTSSESTGAGHAGADKPSIAVLPFENMSADADQDYFADGICNDITAGLSSIRTFFVIARNSSFTYKGRSADASRVAGELGVRYVLEGSVRRAGERIRVSAQLIDASSRRHIWAWNFDRDLEDIFQVQDEITGAIVAAIGPEVDAAERERALRRSTDRLDAWSAYQRGLWHTYRFTQADLEAARGLLRCAINLDRTFALAHAGLSLVHYSRAFLGYDDNREGDIWEAFALARESVLLDDKDATSHWALGRVYKLRGEYDAAIAEFETAIALNRSFARAYYNMGWSLSLAGEPERAIVHLDRALRLSPRDPLLFAFMIVRAHAHLQIGEDERALSWAEKAARQPNAHTHTKAVYAVTLQRCGRHEAAAQLVDEIQDERPEYSCQLFEQSFSFNRHRDMERLLEAMRAAGLPD